MTGRRRRGFTLFDLLVTVTVMAVMAGVLFPMLRDDNKLRVVAASRMLASDLETAQMMTIMAPAYPVVVHFFPGAGRYQLATADDPLTPIKRPGTDLDYVVQFGQGDARHLDQVDLRLEGLAGDTLQFSPQGGLADFSATPTIELFSGANVISLTVSATTGTIREDRR